MSSSVFMFPGPIQTASMAGQTYHGHIPSPLAERHGVLDTPDMSFTPSAPWAFGNDGMANSTSYFTRSAIPRTAQQAHSHTPHNSCAVAETSFRRPMSTTMSSSSTTPYAYSAIQPTGNRFSLPAAHPSSYFAHSRDSTTTTAATKTTPTPDPTTRITIAKQRAIGHRRSHAQSTIAEPQKQLGHRRSCALQIRPPSLDQQKARGHRRSHAQSFANICALRPAAEIAVMRSFRGPILGERTDWGGGSGNGRNGRSSAPPDGDRGTGNNTDNGERGERRAGQLYQRPRAAPLFTPEQLRQAMALHGQVPKVFTPRSVSAQQPRLSTLFPDHDIEDEDEDPVDDTDDKHDQHRRRGRTKDKNSRNHTGTTSTPETPKPDERLLLGARAAAAGIPRDTPTRTQSACSPRDRHNQHFGPLTGINKPLPALPPPSTNDLFLVSGQQVKQLQQLQQLQNYQPQKQHHHLEQLPQSPQPAHLARAHSPNTAAIIPRPLNIVKKKPSFAPSTATSTTGSSTPNWATPPTTPVPVPKPLVWRQHSSGQQQRTPSQRSQESQFSNGSGSGSGGLVGPLVGSGLGSSNLSGGLGSSSNSFGPSGPPPSHPPPAVPPLHHHQFGPLGRWSASSLSSDEEEGGANTDIEYAAVSTEFAGRARNDSTNTLDRIEAELASWAGLQETQTQKQKQKAKAVVGPPREEREELQALPSFASSSTGWDDKGKEKGKAKKDDKEKEKDKEKDKKWWGRGRKDKKEKQKGKEKAEQELDDEKKRREEEAAHSQVVELDEEAYDAEDDWEDDE